MATKKNKDKWLAARIDNDFDKQVSEYVEATEMGAANLVRKAVKEFMANHPIKELGATPELKPGA